MIKRIPKKYIILIASIVIQICLGGVYAWSAFVPALTDVYGFTSAETQIVFGTTIMAFTISMMFAGRILHKKGARFVAGIGGILYGLGYLLSSFNVSNFWFLFLGIGVFTGCGIGCGYVCPLTVCIKWFPKRKGLVTGISVAGFGGGSILLSNIVRIMMLEGLTVVEIFRFVGLIYGLIIVFSALFLSFPKIEEKTDNVLVSLKGLLLKKEFQILCFGMFAGTFSGLLIIGNLKPMALSFGFSPLIATTSISVFALGNALGRVLWGRFFDFMHYKTIAVSLIFVSCAVLLLLLTNGNLILFKKAIFLIGFGFGASFVVFATHIAEIYGQDELPKVYPLIFLFYGFAALTGSFVGGYIYDIKQSYQLAIIIAMILPLTAGLLSLKTIKMQN